MSAAVAKRYAKALFEIAQERNVLDQVENELKLVAETIASLPTLKEWLNHPLTEVSEKKELFSTVFSQLSELTQNFLFLLTDRRREAIIEPILNEYKRFANEARGVAEAEVISAFPLSEKDKEVLVATFERLVGKKIQINSKVDSDLLGGVIVRIGDRLYDGSLRTKLLRFQERLKQSRIG